MSTSDEQRLALYLECESAMLSGRVQEFKENNHWARLLELRDVQAMIEKLQNNIAGDSGRVFRPLR